MLAFPDQSADGSYDRERKPAVARRNPAPFSLLQSVNPTASDMSTAKATWAVVVVYGSQETREAAVSFCDQLVQRFWNQYEFDISWWPGSQLLEQEAAQQAGQRASEADLVIFGVPADGVLPLEVQKWVEGWVPERGEREGALVGLVVQEAQSMETAEAHKFLRQVAHRAGMDYLTQVPQSISWQIPESLESCSERAKQVTSVLDEILHQPPAPRVIGLG
jgi:hypothetical protein